MNHGDRHLTQAWVKGPVPVIHYERNTILLLEERIRIVGIIHLGSQNIISIVHNVVSHWK